MTKTKNPEMDVAVPFTPEEYNRLKRAAEITGISVEQLCEIAKVRLLAAEKVDSRLEVIAA